MSAFFCSRWPSLQKAHFASLYSHKNELVRQHRAILDMAGATFFFQKNILAYFPIAHRHASAASGDWQFWQAHRESFLIGWADALFILYLEGWKQRVGVTAEVLLAQRQGLLIRFLAVDANGSVCVDQLPPGDSLVD